MSKCPLCRGLGAGTVRVGTPKYGRVAMGFAAQHSGFSIEELQEGTRHFKRVRARVAAAMVMREHGDMSWTEIATALNLKSHTSAMASVDSLGDDRDVQHLVRLIRKSMREAVAK